MSLDRFVEAQADGVYETALAELVAGHKQGHWMWFIFPQRKGLGVSQRSNFYGIDSLDEAAAYLAHPLLGPRLLCCAEAMRGHADRGAVSVLGTVDAAKFQSCLTLFARVPGAPPLFAQLLDDYFGGVRDPRSQAD
ncbi:DUF1810 domain-containing protein [Polymorphobacter fuscus]|uniref:DUF1810 family protein n=1 Tax=Sandarakinorhabdus fusca TaxID=1439888 RepID=A0A7C9KY73_9SPHN|nr:DUF1810 domain-containing protein [Polymorphobacter fuscus]KAB7649007.1 DUF1810 domain-containing protein [Polymorphobacter fuscus]MQT16608.1 DUF1810 family protein [Polymorphobacter fuscus]NJC07102.1 uncharacterized protein (DUF1810 family) [Polymorphobacter fuscus]